jgi:hypothetical protein
MVMLTATATNMGAEMATDVAISTAMAITMVIVETTASVMAL